MNSGLEKIAEFISEKGDFGDSSYRYVRQDENHKCGNQHFQDFAAVCQPSQYIGKPGYAESEIFADIYAALYQSDDITVEFIKSELPELYEAFM